MLLNTPRSKVTLRTKRSLSLVHEEAARTNHIWITTFGLLAFLPIPVAVLAAQNHTQTSTYRVLCSYAHPCPFQITGPNTFRMALPVWEVVSHQP